MPFDIENHNFDGDDLKPKHVLEQVEAHDKRMDVGSVDWAQAKAMYMTMYWAYRNQGKNRKTTKSMETRDIDIEVNRLWSIVGAYLAALYPRASRTVVSPDPADRGDPKLTEIVLNHWLSSKRVHQRIMDALRQAIMYPGCGAKMGHSPGRGTAIERTWLRIIPWWELLLDFDVTDPEDQRFIGHVYSESKSKIEREYDLVGLRGTGRMDFLSQPGSRTAERQDSGTTNEDKADSDSDAFVRVLELCNLVDTIEIDGVTYIGRLEIYVLDQSGDISKRPVYMGPLPVARPSGDKLPHIIPLIFNYEPEFPLRGIAHSARMLPQLKELNLYRSFLAMASRKDTRQYLTWKGTFTDDELAGLTEGEDGLIMQISKDGEFQGRLEDALVAVKNSPVSPNVHLYTQTVENDLDRIVGTSPNARGDITKGTAYEVRNTQFYTESEYGMHAMIKDQWMANLVYLAQRVIIDAMQTTEGSSGEYAASEEGAVEYASSDARLEGDQDESGEFESPSENTDDFVAQPGEGDLSDDAAADVASDISGSPKPLISSLLKPPWKNERDGSEVRIVQETLRVKDRNEVVEVTVEDLDAEFEIEFVEGGRTPMADAQMQANLVQLADLYFKLWEVANKGGTASVLALNYMRALAERFDLPKDIHPTELLAEVDSKGIKTLAGEEAEERQPQGQPGAQPPGAAPQPQAPAGPPSLADIDAMPDDQLAALLLEMSGGAPEAKSIINRVAKLPAPERHAFLVQAISDAFAGAQGQPANGQAAAPPAPGVEA